MQCHRKFFSVVVLPGFVVDAEVWKFLWTLDRTDDDVQSHSPALASVHNTRFRRSRRLRRLFELCKRTFCS